MNLENVACISAYRRYDQKGILQPMQSATSLTNRPARQLRPFDRDDLCTAQVGRGRDGDFSPPPAQIRTCGFPAYGSYLG